MIPAVCGAVAGSMAEPEAWGCCFLEPGWGAAALCCSALPLVSPSSRSVRSSRTFLNAAVADVFECSPSSAGANETKSASRAAVAGAETSTALFMQVRGHSSANRLSARYNTAGVENSANTDLLSPDRGEWHTRLIANAEQSYTIFPSGAFWPRTCNAAIRSYGSDQRFRGGGDAGSHGVARPGGEQSGEFFDQRL